MSVSHYGFSSSIHSLKFAIEKYRKESLGLSEIDKEYDHFQIEYGSVIGSIKLNAPDLFNKIKDADSNIVSISETIMHSAHNKPHHHVNEIITILKYASQILEILKIIEERKKNGESITPEKTELESTKKELSHLQNKIEVLTKQSKYENLIESTLQANIPLNWIIGAAHVCLLENVIKKWIVEKCNEDLHKLKNKQFQELIGIIEKYLKTNGIPYNQKKLSDMAGRQFRNKIIHELHTPSDDELREVIQENNEFVTHLNSLIN